MPKFIMYANECYAYIRPEQLITVINHDTYNILHFDNFNYFLFLFSIHF